jgi:hypothetical protein
VRLASLWALALLAPGVSAAQTPPVAAEPLQMPPFLVEEQKGDGIEWSYGSSADIRVLSGCGAGETAAFLRQAIDQRDELRKFIPGEFLLHESLPPTLVIFPRSQKQAMDRVVETELTKGAAASSRHFAPMNDLRLSDPDSSDIFIVFDDNASSTQIWLRDGDRVSSMSNQTPVLSPSYVRFLLQARAPALPDWYVSGCVGLYETMDFKPAGDPGAGTYDTGRLGTTAVGFEPEPWLSDTAAPALRRHPDGARPLIPMRELLAARYPFAKSDEYRRVWEAQAELFVRWALSGRVDGGQERLRRLVEGASTQRTTEEFFYACFGIDYADALDALSDYLPYAVGKPLRVPADAGLRAAPPELHAATAAEVRRVKSEWSRRVLWAIKEDNPGAFPLFAGKVRDSLEGAFARGERDPDFVASLALFRIMYGKPDDGIRLLEQFPAAAATRPVAQLVLAQQHLQVALANPSGAKGKLGEEQASRLLREIIPPAPASPLESAYALAARVCEHLGRDPTPSERAILVDGARLFPRNADLVVQAAAWELRAGEVRDAESLVEFGLWESADPAARRNLVALDNLARQALTVASVQGRSR